MRSNAFQSLVRSQPSLLLYRGSFLGPKIRARRVTREAILAAMRSGGAAAPSEVDAVVLDTDGSFSVVTGAGDGQIESLRYVATGPRETADWTDRTA